MTTINWSLVEDQFKDRSLSTIQYLTDIWAKRMGVATLKMDKDRKVVEEYWSHKRLYKLLKSMHPYETRNVY